MGKKNSRQKTKRKNNQKAKKSCFCNFLAAVKGELEACIYRSCECPSKEETFSCKEQGKRAVYKVGTNELAYLFVVDPQHDGSCKKKNNHCLKCKNICDFILVSCVLEVEREKKFAAFVELKGNKVKKAVKQIKETIKAFKSLFPKHNWKYKIFAAIATSGSTHKDLKDPKLKELIDNYPIPIKTKEIDLTYLKKQV